MKKQLIALLLVTLAALSARSQETWTLQQCIDYASEHSIQLMQSRIQVKNAELQLHTARMSRLPDLNASMGQGFGFGRSQGRDGTTEDITSANTSIGIYTSVPLFTAFRIPNQIKANRESLLSAKEQVEAQRRQLAITVATYYLNALYYEGLADVARQQVTVDSLLLEQTQALVSAGRKPQSEEMQAEAQLATSRLQLTTAIGSQRSANLDLLQSINLDRDVQLTLVPPNDNDAEMQAALTADFAVSAHPTILSAQHQLRASQYQLSVARSSYFPTLSFSAGYSTGYYHSYNYQNLPFGRQINLNGSENISLSLSIPIFNRFSIRNNVKRSELDIQNQRLQLDEAQRQLKRQIQQARIDALNAAERLRSAKTAEAANAEAYQCEHDKYAAGTSTLYTLGQAQQRLTSARNDAVQAHIELMLRLHILKYYE